MAGSSSCTTRSSVARRRRPAPRSSSNHAARRAATAARVASVALGRCRSACHGWPPTRTLAVDRSPPIPGGARRRPRFGCMKHEPGGRFHVAATEDLITEQRHGVDRRASRRYTSFHDRCGPTCKEDSRMSESKQLFSANLAKHAVYKTGLRSFMEYRDLGIEKATHGQFRAHVVRIKKDGPGAHDLHTTGLHN